MRSHVLQLVALSFACTVASQSFAEEISLQDIQFSWKTADPLLSPPGSTHDLNYSIREPSIVFFEDRWHLFCTLRGKNYKRRIEYLSFADWTDLSDLRRTPLNLTRQPCETPQVFYSTVQKFWVLVFQLDSGGGLPVIPMLSTSANLANSSGWSSPVALPVLRPEQTETWADFWVIWGESKAHLFFSSNDGRIWHSETREADFPDGWSAPQVAIRGDFVGAPHVYRVRGTPDYLALVEAHRQWRRYCKAYFSQDLNGPWRPLAVTRAKPFASLANVEFIGESWTDTFGHGEMLRAGYDEKLELELNTMRFVYQGSSYDDREGRTGKEVPWRLGILIDDRP